MGVVSDFINRVKDLEGLKFDGQVANLIGMDSRILATYKSRDNLPFKLQQWYCDRYQVKIKDFHKEIKLTNTDIPLEGAGNMEANYIIELQKDKIEHLQYKINKLSKLLDKQKTTKKDSWLDIQFDVLTRQSYDKSFCNYKTYEIIKYQDFFKKLGYNNDEVDYQYENHKNEMLQSDWKYDDSTLHSTVLGSKKDDAWVMKYKNKNITLYEYLDVRMKLGKLYATYDTPVQYYHKDGHFVNAYIYCSWDLQRLTGETKIKFLSE
jgi:hypothetical protein